MTPPPATDTKRLATPGIQDLRLATAATRQRVGVELDVLDRSIRQLVSNTLAPEQVARSPAVYKPRQRMVATFLVVLREIFALMRARRTGARGTTPGAVILRLLTLVVVARARRP